MTDELKPCPFCGGDAELVECDYAMYETGYAVYCIGDCRAKLGVTGRLGEVYEWTTVFSTEHDAIEAWNTRTPEQAVAATLGGDDKSRYSGLFGTPERAADYFAMQCFGSDGSMCYYCPFDDCDGKLRNSGAHHVVYEAMLELLRGDAE